jgi:hypothetical protein
MNWPTALWIAGAVLVLLGAERLLSVRLLPHDAATFDLRLLIAWVSIAAGGLLLGLGGLGVALRRRR